jgi:hypothetical protein
MPLPKFLVIKVSQTDQLDLRLIPIPSIASPKLIQVETQNFKVEIRVYGLRKIRRVRTRQPPRRARDLNSPSSNNALLVLILQRRAGNRCTSCKRRDRLRHSVSQVSHYISSQSDSPWTSQTPPTAAAAPKKAWPTSPEPQHYQTGDHCPLPTAGY